MFRKHFHTLDKQWLLHIPSLSSGEATVVVNQGECSLLRQRDFKFEKLVPVLPTRYVMVILPLSLAHEIAILETASTLDDASVPRFEWIEKFVNELRAMISFPIQVVDVSFETRKKETIVTLDVFEATNTIDVLDACDNKFPSKFFPSYGGGSSSSRRAVAFPCDARNENDVGGWDVVQESYYSLPICMLCCDRLDRSVSGIVANICDCDCGACSCLADSPCVACSAALTAPNPGASAKNSCCFECHSGDDSWVCLVCDYVGCSRYRSMHVKEHCVSSCHNFSMSLTTQQIWDYLSDRFVHRMIVTFNMTTGTSELMRFPEGGNPLVENNPQAAFESQAFEEALAASRASHRAAQVPPHAKSPDGTHKGWKGESTSSKVLVDAKLDVKIEQCCKEFTRQLTTYLAAQRRFYAALLHTNERNDSTFSCTSSALLETRSSEMLKSSFQSLHHEEMAARKAIKDYQGLQEKLDARRSAVATLEAESIVAEREQSELKQQYKDALMSSSSRAGELDKEIRELEDTIKEVQLNLVVSKKIAKAAGGDQATGAMAVLGGAAQTKRKK